VRSRQWELRCAVIERCRLPHGGRVTILASMTESCCHVIWIRRFREIRRVARVTVTVHQFVIAIDVTRLTWRRDVCAGESELRRAMIER
jgi:hypothetical protein